MTSQYRNYILAGLVILVVLGMLLFFYGTSRFINYLHDVNYQHQQNKDKTAANTAEVNANTHEANANQAANNRQELEKDEKTINQEQANQQKILATSKRKTASTRKQLDAALDEKPASRSGNDGMSDDQLRADSDRAAAAINTRPVKGTTSPKP
jgi:preprotein translocase subunit SecF